MQTLRYSSLGVLFLLLLAACSTSSSQQKDEHQNNTNSEKVAYKPQEYHIPNEMKYIKQKFDFLHDKFKPIGWSVDGKLAYINEAADEACGCYFFELTIVDLFNKKTLYTFSYNDEGAGENLTDVWEKNYRAFRTKLNDHKIIQSGILNLENRKLEYQNKNYNFKVINDLEKDKDFGIDVVKSTTVEWQIDDKKASKVTFKTDATDMILNTTLPGILLNPHNKQIAVLLQQERRGYEGPPNVLSLKIFGVNLTSK